MATVAVIGLALVLLAFVVVAEDDAARKDIEGWATAHGYHAVDVRRCYPFESKPLLQFENTNIYVATMVRGDVSRKAFFRRSVFGIHKQVWESQ